MQNDVLTSFINGRVRPDAERVRAAFARGVDMAQAVASTIAPLLVAAGKITVGQDGSLTPVSDTERDEVIDDGRASEGVAALTIGELCTLVNTFGGLTASIDADTAFKNAISKASVRPLTVSD